MSRLFVAVLSDEQKLLQITKEGVPMTASRYEYSQHDGVMIAATRQLIDKLTRSNVLTPAQRVSVAKMQFVLSRLPRVTEDLDLSIHVTGPRRLFGEIQTYHWWTIAIEDAQICVTGGGHFYRPSTGGDSFSTFRWAAAPGWPSEYLDHLENLTIVPDIAPFDVMADRIDFAKATYEVEVTDSENVFLGEDNEDEDEVEVEDSEFESQEDSDLEDADADSDDEDVPAPPFQICPVDEAESSLAAMIDSAMVNRRPAEYAYGVEQCDFCKRPVEELGLFVDGNVQGGGGWANMCAKCFELKGLGIAWGKGQLYARQSNDSWRLARGFQRE